MKERGNVTAAIALIIVLSFCAFAIYIGLRPLPNANQHFIDIALGALVTQFANVSAYFFGSSRSAERAQTHIDAITPAAQPSVAEVTAPPGKFRPTVPPPRSPSP